MAKSKQIYVLKIWHKGYFKGTYASSFGGVYLDNTLNMYDAISFDDIKKAKKKRDELLRVCKDTIHDVDLSIYQLNTREVAEIERN